MRRFYERLADAAPPLLRTFGQDERNAVSDAGATYVVLRPTAARRARLNLVLRGAQPVAAASFSFRGGRANVLIGNPPWVAFRHMTDESAEAVPRARQGRGLYVGGKLATQNDLCALFTARCASLYLKGSGRIAFVLPLAALTRGQFERLRSGVSQRLDPMGGSLDDGRQRSTAFSRSLLRRIRTSPRRRRRRCRRPCGRIRVRCRSAIAPKRFSMRLSPAASSR